MAIKTEEARLLEKTIDAAPTGFCSVGVDGRFFRANSKFCEMLGYTREELARLKFSDLTHPEDRGRDIEAFQAMLDGTLAEYHREKRYIRKDGQTVWVDLISSLLHDENGKPLYFVSIMQDITLRHETQAALSASERRFRTLFEQAPFSVQLLDLRGRTLQVNSAWQELWQAKSEATLKYVLEEYNVLTDPQLEAKGITPYIRAAYAGESVVTDPILYDPKDIGQEGRARYLMAYVHPIKDENGKVVEVMLIHHDVTERVEAEEKLTSAKESAESANRLKSSFLANMSHEIRTPLSAILGFTELLRDRDLDEGERNEYLQIIERSGKSLTQIIDDILDLSRVEAGSLKIEIGPIRIRDMVEEALGLFKVESKKKGISLSYTVDASAPEVVHSDPVRMRQIVLNLIGNAIKFTPAGSVSVVLTGDESTLSVIVKDSGIGISAQDQTRLFRPFSQADSSNTRKFGGTGLGLALSRRLAIALGGNVQLSESAVDKGSTFVFTVPTYPAETQISFPAVDPDGSEDSANLSLGGCKILVVDDIVENRLLIEQILTLREAQVESVGNGKEALDRVAASEFDLILMDIQMPVMDGLEATRQLRRAGFTKPIIAHTAHAMKEDLQRSLEAGCDAHLAKPVFSKSLITTIRQQMRRQSPSAI